MMLIWHLIKSFFRAFFKITYVALISGAIAAEIVLLFVKYYAVDWPPTPFMVAMAIAVGALTAYAAGLTTLVFAALHAALTVGDDAVKGVEREIAHADSPIRR
jgi:hypothetical protein